MTKQKPWRDFEVLLTTIHKKLALGANVVHNTHITGRSGRRRQIDILISQTIGLYEARIVIECRRYRRVVTIDKVEGFVAKLADLEASQGVMVSRTGFDAGAKAIAKDNRITLLTYREASEVDWQKATGASAWLHTVATRKEAVSIFAHLAGQPEHYFRPDATISNVNNGSSTSMREFAESIARESPLGQRPGTYDVDFEADTPLRVVENNATHDITLFRVTCRVRAFEYVTNLTLAGGHILADSTTGAARYEEFTSAPWDVHQLLSSAPARELTADAYDRLVADGRKVAVADPAKLKRYMRVVFTPQHDPK